jgi:predicted RND superfamily exporter protein
MGHFPLVVATGPGAGARNSIGIMLVSGMIVGTAFTLLVVPSIYMLVARKRAATFEEAAELETLSPLPEFRPVPVTVEHYLKNETPRELS